MALTTDQLVKIYTNANLGKAPDAATGFVLSLYSTQSGNGTLTDAQATSKALDLVDGTTAVAVSAYQFFTGKTPSAAGLAYLVNSDDAATGGNKSHAAEKLGLSRQGLLNKLSRHGLK
jgi:S-layer protein